MQYGHARLCAILRKAAEFGVALPPYPDMEVPALVQKLALPEDAR